VEFRILGPLEVVDEGRPVSIRRGKERALLIYLLLRANEIVPSGQLIDALWDERPPTTASKILQNAVSHLRKELGNGRLLTRGPGYLLRVEEGELDLERFERLAKEGHGEEALALWRGPPLFDLREERFADEARRHLEEQRLAVLEDRIDDDLGAGRHADVVPELEQLVGEHPLRERLQGQLMRALYGAGRQTDALEAYRQARRTLSEELGLEPGPQLQELERKILTQDPELAPPPAARRQRPPPTPPSSRARRRVALVGLTGALLAGAALTFALIHTLGGAGALHAKQNSLVVIDPHGNRVVGVVPLGKTPRGLAIGRNAVWVTNSADGTVSEIDPKRLKVIQTIGIGAQATDAVVTADGVWVVTGIDNTLVHIDERSGGIVETLRLSEDPTANAHAVAAGGGAIWASSGDRVLKIDPRTGTIIAGHRHRACCHAINDVTVGAGAVWIADLSEKLFRISLADARVTGFTDLGTIPLAVTVAYGSVWLAVPDPSISSVALWRVDQQTMRVTQTITVGKSVRYLQGMEIAAGGGSLWVTNYELGTVVRVDPGSGTVKATIKVRRSPFGIAFGADRVWVTVT
jgi:YVTN family beta-propeller protein